MTTEPAFVTKPQTSNSPRMVLAYLFWTGVGFAIIVVLFNVSGLSISRLMAIVKSVPVWFYFILACLQAGILLLASVKWQIVLGQFPVGGRILPLKDALAGTTLGALAGQVLPIQLVTPVTRAWVARPHQISAARAVGTSVFEQVFEVVVLLSMGLISALVLVAKLGPVLSGLFTLVAGLVVVALISPVFLLLRKFSKWASDHLPAIAAKGAVAIEKALHQASAFPHRILYQLTALSFLRYLGMVTLNVWTISVLLPGSSFLLLALAYPTVLLVMSLPFIPGGLGVVEVTWVGVLITQGATPAEAVEVALSLRVVSTIAFLAVAPLMILFRTRLVEAK